MCLNLQEVQPNLLHHQLFHPKIVTYLEYNSWTLYKINICITSGSACTTSGSTGWTGAGVSTIVGVGAAGVASTGGGLLGNGGGISPTSFRSRIWNKIINKY